MIPCQDLDHADENPRKKQKNNPEPGDSESCDSESAQSENCETESDSD